MIKTIALWTVTLAVSASPAVPATSAADPVPDRSGPAVFADYEAAASVLGLSIRPAGDRTEVFIDLDGPADISDYMLENPARVVIDLSGARHALPREQFPAIDRGGVVGVRTSQFNSSVVRVVLDLSSAVDYRVAQDDDGVRVSFTNPGSDFQPWQSGTPAGGVAEGLLDASNAEEASAPRQNDTAAQASAADEPESSLPLPEPIIAEQPPISVTFEGVAIRDVIATFAAFSGRSIVTGAGIEGMVDATITEQPWDIALQAILQSLGLEAQEMESGIIRVEEMGKLQERVDLAPAIMRQFPIRYISVDSVVPAVEGLLSETGKVTRSRSTNTLIVTDRPSVVEGIAPIIDALDERTAEVTVSAKIIFVDRTALEQLGVVYDIKDSRGNQLNEVTPGFTDSNNDGVLEPSEMTEEDVVLLGGSSIAALANANDRLQNPALQILSSLVLGRHTLVNFLEALQSLQLTDIQAVPSIKVMDQRQARVQVGEETPIRVLDASSAGGGEGGPRATVNFKETGIILEVTPRITGSQVLLELHAERSSAVPAESDIGATFQTQEATTQVLLDDGETAVISGLTLVEKNTIRSGIPYLMDLPVLGGLFRTTRDQENKRDLLIMVTPHIDRSGN